MLASGWYRSMRTIPKHQLFFIRVIGKHQIPGPARGKILCIVPKLRPDLSISASRVTIRASLSGNTFLPPRSSARVMLGSPVVWKNSLWKRRASWLTTSRLSPPSWMQSSTSRVISSPRSVRRCSASTKRRPSAPARTSIRRLPATLHLPETAGFFRGHLEPAIAGPGFLLRCSEPTCGHIAKPHIFLAATFQLLYSQIPPAWKPAIPVALAKRSGKREGNKAAMA